MDDRERGIIELIKMKHADQWRADGTVPVWLHLARVAGYLSEVLEATGEGTAEERREIALAGYGHDTLEDTDVTEDELRESFGPRGLELIKGMTNEIGDHDVGPYVEQVCAAEEGVRLIKLSDLYDNCTSVTYTLFTLGTEWADGYFLPIVEPMIGKIMDTEFATYPKAAARLKDMVRASYATLKAEVERYRSLGK